MRNLSLETSVFRRGVDEVLALLGCYATHVCCCSPTIWDSPSVKLLGAWNWGRNAFPKWL